MSRFSPRRRRTSAARSSSRLAGGDWFTPRDLEVLRAPPLAKSPLPVDASQLGATRPDAENSLMSAGPVVWLDDRGIEVAAPEGDFSML